MIPDANSTVDHEPTSCSQSDVVADRLGQDVCASESATAVNNFASKIEVRDLDFHYGAVRALSNVSILIPPVA